MNFKKYIIVTFLVVFVNQVSLGQTWKKLNIPKTGLTFADIAIGNDNNLYLMAKLGLYKSTDNGMNWTLYDKNVSNAVELEGITKNGLVFIDKSRAITKTDGTDLEYVKGYASSGYYKSAKVLCLSSGEIIFAYRKTWGDKGVAYSISTDKGKTFVDKKTTAKFKIPNYKAPIMFVNNKDEIYYVGEDKTMYKSTDKGLNYTSSGTKYFGDVGNTSLSCIDKKIGTLYFTGFVGGKVTVNNSTDDGKTWTTVTLPTYTGRGITAYDNKVIVYGGKFCYYSTDGGKTFTEKTNLFAFDAKVYPSKYLITTSGKILILNHNGDGVSEIDFSTGKTTQRTEGINFTNSKAHSYNGKRLVATFSGRAYYTDDDGKNWTKLKGDGAIGQDVFVSKNGNVFVSSNKSGTWNGVFYKDNNDSMVKTTADVKEVWNMARTGSMFEDDKGNVYCVSNLNGLYKSTDGKAFTRLENGPFENLNPQTMWFNKSNKKIMTFYGETIYSSADYGKTWIKGTLITGSRKISHLFFKGDGGAMWDWAWEFKGEPNKTGFYYSHDLKTWHGPYKTKSSFDGRWDQLIGGNKPGFLYTANTKGHVSMSKDTGKTWSKFEDGLDSFKYMGDVNKPKIMVPVVRISAGGNKLILSTDGSLYMADQGKEMIGINKVHKNNIATIYPNPTDGILVIKLKGKATNVKVSISNYQGQIVKRFQAIKNGQIDISDLPTGNYIVTLTHQKEKQHFKIIKF